MNSKDKLLAAMENGLRSDFPVVVPYMGIFLRDHWEEVTDLPWWTNYGLHLSQRLLVEEELLNKLDLDWVWCAMCPPAEWRESHRIETRGSRVFLVDTSSREEKEMFREPKGGAHLSLDGEPLIKTMEDVDRYIKVVDAETLIQSGRLDYIKMAVEKFGSEKFMCVGTGSPYWAALHITHLGFRGVILGLFRNPNLVEYALKRILAWRIEELRAYAEVGIDGVWMEECLGSSDEISVDQFKRFVLPYTRGMIEEMKRLDLKCIYYPCGDLRDRLELMIQSNPDCIALEEGKKGFEVDIEWMDKVVDGRTCIFGNLDAIKILQDGTPSELRREIQRQLNVGRRHGKLVMSIGSPVTPKTTTTRVREYVDITRQESK